MYVAKILFDRKESIISKDIVIGELQVFVSSLRFGGQIQSNDFHLAITENQFIVIVHIQEKVSLKDTYMNNYTRNCLDLLKNEGVELSGYKIIGNDPTGTASCGCKKNERFIMATSCLSIDSPLICKSCYLPVPFYKLGETSKYNFQTLVEWQDIYNAFDRLFLDSDKYENYAFEQLANPNSELNVNGLDCCENIAEKYGFPVYYYIFSGIDKNDNNSAICPKCNRKMGLISPGQKKFKYQCEECMIILS